MLKFGTEVPMDESEHNELYANRTKSCEHSRRRRRKTKHSGCVYIKSFRVWLRSEPANEVARAKALVADPNYPSPEQMEKVAGVLAANWPREK
jgi:hypothetical protein